jgi:hypothetical protein
MINETIRGVVARGWANLRGVCAVAERSDELMFD